MPFPQKDYLYVEDMVERWACKPRDLHYCMENGLIEVEVYLASIPSQHFKMRKNAKGKPIKHPIASKILNGFYRLHPDDCRKILRSGQATLRHVYNEDLENTVFEINRDQQFQVKLSHLSVNTNEADRFEKKYNLDQLKQHDLFEHKSEDKFWHSADYHQVRVNEYTFFLGTIQASIIRQLHEGHLQGNPWMHGKVLLGNAGSNSMKLFDLFKKQPHRNKLIRSNRRGLYCLNIQ